MTLCTENRDLCFSVPLVSPPTLNTSSLLDMQASAELAIVAADSAEGLKARGKKEKRAPKVHLVRCAACGISSKDSDASAGRN